MPSEALSSGMAMAIVVSLRIATKAATSSSQMTRMPAGSMVSGWVGCAPACELSLDKVELRSKKVCHRPARAEFRRQQPTQHTDRGDNEELREPIPHSCEQGEIPTIPRPRPRRACAAEGWIDDALASWRTNRIQPGVGNDVGSGPITVRSLRVRVLSQNYSSGGKGTRTPNPLLAKQMRYQLRHTPVRVLTLTPNRCARTIRPRQLGSHAATGRRLRVPRA